MSDHDSDPGAAPDPIDAAYVQAEAMLSEDDARAARRARVLGAVAVQPAALQPAALQPVAMAAAPPIRQPAAMPTAPSMKRPPAWRRGGWLAAACVVGLGVFVAVQIYRPVPRQLQTAPATPETKITARPAPGAPGTVALQTPSVSEPPQAPAFKTQAAEPPAPVPETAPSDSPAPAPPPPPLNIAPAPEAFPAAPQPPIVTGERAARSPAPEQPAPVADGAAGKAADEQVLSRQTERRDAAPTFTARSAVGSFGGFESSDSLRADPAAQLRAAAAAGRTSELAALLGQGVAVDAPDAAGDTALMKSVQADHPAAAALLRRHGASLDHKNHAGESARDIAASKGDAALNQAIGVVP